MAMTVAVLAAILSIIFGHSRNLTAMTAVAVAGILAFRPPRRPQS